MAVMEPEPDAGIEEHDRDEVVLVARGIATAVAPEDGLTDVQAALLGAIAEALTGCEVDYHDLEPLHARGVRRGPGRQARVVPPADRAPHGARRARAQAAPPEVAWPRREYASALGIEDQFVRIAHRYAQGATGLAWIDLQRSGFTAHLEQADRQRGALPGDRDAVREAARPTPRSSSCGVSFEDLAEDSLGRKAWEMYDGRGFALPGTPEGASPYLAQHDFVHVLADYGTNLKGELEVFALIGRAEPRPAGLRVARHAGRPVRDRATSRTRASSSATSASTTSRRRGCTCASPTRSGAARS